ncbi:MAG: ABC transporter permease [Deltaproteobacteria bacterium]|nr:ABC transporter permease [Deltaproteobacteria bacterium]
MKRFFAIVGMAVKQKLRDRLALSLALLTAPLFVVFYWVLFNDTERVYRVDVLDLCAMSAASCQNLALPMQSGKDANTAHVQNIRKALAQVSREQGGFEFKFNDVSSLSEAKSNLRKGVTDVVVFFSTPLITGPTGQSGASAVELFGDVSSANYQFCAMIIERVITGYASRFQNATPPVIFRRQALGVSDQKTPFEAYVPGLLVFAVIMLIFSSAMSVVKEIEAGTFARMAMAPVSTVQLVGGLSLVQLVVGILSVILTFMTASLLQFKSEGSIVVAMVVAAIACAASVGIGMVVAAVAKTQSRAFLISSIVMFLLVLFSGIIFPRPELTVFYLGGHPVDLFDVLPTTHLGNALNKVLSLGAPASDVWFEMSVLSVIALSSFLLGSLLFARSGKPAATTWEGML